MGELPPPGVAAHEVVQAWPECEQHTRCNASPKTRKAYGLTCNEDGSRERGKAGASQRFAPEQNKLETMPHDADHLLLLWQDILNEVSDRSRQSNLLVSPPGPQIRFSQPVLLILVCASVH